MAQHKKSKFRVHKKSEFMVRARVRGLVMDPLVPGSLVPEGSPWPDTKNLSLGYIEIRVLGLGLGSGFSDGSQALGP